MEIKEITKEEAQNTIKGQCLIYNTLTRLYKIENFEDKNFIARSKYASSALKYYTIKGE